MSPIDSKKAPGPARSEVPSYLRHKKTGVAFTIMRDAAGQRRQVQLGPWNSPESKRRYREIIAAHQEGTGMSAPGPVVPKPEDITIAELAKAWLEWADTYYVRPDGSPTAQAITLAASVRELLALYGDTAVCMFGAKRLKQVRDEMITGKLAHELDVSRGLKEADDPVRGLARSTINTKVRCIVSMFRWGAENEMSPVSAYDALRVVTGLRFGRSGARETPPREPVADAVVDATLPHLPPMVRVMVEVQRLTGMRSHEVCELRTGDIDMTRDVWVYSPRRSKSMYRGRRPGYCIGPRAQQLLKPLLKLDPDAFLFCPSESELQRNQERRAKRRTPLYPSHLARLQQKRARNPAHSPGDHYDAHAYRRAVDRAARAAKVPPWTPHQLRHLRASKVRAVADIETARACLGHASASMTEVYAKLDLEKAAAVARVIG